MASSRRRLLLIALGLSAVVHIAAALLILLLPRVLPRQANQPEQGTVELLMVEQKGAKPSAVAHGMEHQPATSSPAASQPEASSRLPKPRNPAEPSKPPNPKPPNQVKQPKPSATTAAPAAAAPAPAPPDSPDGSAPKPAEPPSAKAAKATDSPVPPPPPPAQPAAKPQQAPVFDLAGTESESNAVALGGRIVPASPDNRFRNRPPIYPPEAETRGEHGTVVVMIHVSEDGLASSVDVAQSSGVAVLDRAAVEAVRKWRFRPALRQGRGVPFDMPFRFVFEAD